MGLLDRLRKRRDERRRQEQLAIGREVLDEALQQAKAQVEVPAEVERSFVARFWQRLNRLTNWRP